MGSQTPTREITNVAVLDLTGYKSPEGLDGVTKIADVALVLVPESLLEKFMTIPQEHVAATVPVPDGTHVKVITGQITMSGEALATAGGDSEACLVVMGQLLVTSLVEKVGYRGMVVMGQVFAPEGSESALGAGLTRLMGEVIYYPQGSRIKSLGGQVKMGGEALANPAGDEKDILVVGGQLLVTSPVAKVGYGQLIVAGQMVAPRESENVLSPRLRVSGQLLYYSGKPRFVVGDEHFGQAFFTFLKEPTTLVLIGDVTIEPGVTAELIQEKVSEIVLAGDLRAPKELVPLLQFLTVEKQGNIIAAGDEE